jgi:CRISPR-associated protein Csh1
MLDTLLKIGEWQVLGKGEWDRFLDKPKTERENKKGVKIKNYVVGLVFDLDEQTVYLDASSLKEYDEERDLERLKLLKIQDRNGKAIYATTEPQKLIQVFKTFFGKVEDKKGNVYDAEIFNGELCEAIDKDFLKLKDSKLYEIVKSIFKLRKSFLDLALNAEKGEIDHKIFFAALKLEVNENIVLTYASLKSTEFGFPKPTPIAELNDYKQFLALKCLTKASQIRKEGKLCYASGELKEDVNELNLTSRYSLNKMFVTETKNYASQFDSNLFALNYQISTGNQALLDLASGFLLEKYKVTIAGLDHLIIPQFLHSDNINLEIALKKLKTDSELLFSFRALGEMADTIEIEAAGTYWINFLAFESDGNFFKTTNLIKDVSKFHFKNIIETFNTIGEEMREMKEVLDWDATLTEYGKVSHFNLNSIYGLIPIRKDKEKKNIALVIFKAILEQRKIEGQHLFSHFTELILCHYYERYGSYTNIHKSGKDYFGLTIRNSVFKYLAFIQVLKSLNLINMEQEIQTGPIDEIIREYEKRIDDFFLRMKFTEPQRAMFYLGRMLNAVAYLQKDKNKTVIDKINYRGMDKDDIIRLRKDLFEKAKQYGKPEKVVYSDSHFGQYFDFNGWSMSPEESVFFLLTGYSFGVVKKDVQS